MRFRVFLGMSVGKKSWLEVDAETAEDAEAKVGRLVGYGGSVNDDGLVDDEAFAAIGENASFCDDAPKWRTTGVEPAGGKDAGE